MSDYNKHIAPYYHQDEKPAVENLLTFLTKQKLSQNNIQKMATKLVKEAQKNLSKISGFSELIHYYDLSTKEGLALMSLPEALLRIPDQKTAIDLIQDKLSKAEWLLSKEDNKEVGYLTHFARLSLQLTNHFTQDPHEHEAGFKNLFSKLSAPLIHQAMLFSMKLLGEYFVMGSDIQQALKRSKKIIENHPYSFSYDMLGESARTQEEAEAYFNLYKEAIIVIGKSNQKKSIEDAPGISVKLSALSPNFTPLKYKSAVKELTTKLKILCLEAQREKISLCVDAEEARYLAMSLEIVENIHTDPDLKDYDGFGLAVQAYQKRAFYVISYLERVAKKAKKRLFIRLVKGAYWDSEIKDAQIEGCPDYPVFTKKASTDCSYLACAHLLMEKRGLIFYPQFATHNASSIAYIAALAKGNHEDYELQRLHGMGDEIYHPFFDPKFNQGQFSTRIRIYAPVGRHQTLLPYLVRRLLENGANSSFIHQLYHEKKLDHIVENPIKTLHAAFDLGIYRHAKISPPPALYGAERLNSKTILIDERAMQKSLKKFFETYKKKLNFICAPIISGEKQSATNRLKLHIINPTSAEKMGTLIESNAQDIEQAICAADQAFPAWSQQSIDFRARCLEKMADLLEENSNEFLSLLILEAGKNWPDAIAELREAVDFCRYYAQQARNNYSAPLILPGPTGESNQLTYHGRGIFVAISPWNFPLAIFLGQIAAALVAGNSVLAKPAEDTSFIAMRAIELFHQSGIPREVLQFIPGRGAKMGPMLIPNPKIAGVVFTGSTGVAHWLNRTLSARVNAPIVPLIAETGGQNAMIVDASALTEQVVDDVIESCFRSSGQRCSALRILFLQEDIADKTIKMLIGAAQLLEVSDPANMTSDIGPIINKAAKENLESYIAAMKAHKDVKTLYGDEEEIPEKGFFVAPHIFELKDLKLVEEEHFGPILHIIRFKAEALDTLTKQINALNFGLTFGIHTRIESRVKTLYETIHAGNIYVNRNMIGAVVGVQPFGGSGLSGTGPKAGGPNYLTRFMNERTLTINISAAGGNASLLQLKESPKFSSK